MTMLGWIKEKNTWNIERNRSARMFLRLIFRCLVESFGMLVQLFRNKAKVNRFHRGGSKTAKFAFWQKLGTISISVFLLLRIIRCLSSLKHRQVIKNAFVSSKVITH